jgi:nitroreductase
MELLDALRTTGAIREFRPDPVPDDVLFRVLDSARFAPSGGNRQGWRVVVVKDPAIRGRLRDLYLPGWYRYLAQRADGMTPYAPLNDPADEDRAAESAPKIAADAAAGPGGFPEHLDEVPVLLVLLADMQAIAAVDKDLARYTFAGGASVYPFAWNLLLAARSEGLGGVMTTMVVRAEPEVRELLAVPDELAVAGVLALGYPVRELRKLTRTPVEDFTTVDRVGGPRFEG